MDEPPPSSCTSPKMTTNATAEDNETNVTNSATCSKDDTSKGMTSEETCRAAAPSSSETKNDNNQDGNNDQPPLSKKAKKRLLRVQAFHEKKRLRKAMVQQRKADKAKEQGRNVEAEKQQMQLNAQEGTGRRKREEKWQQKLQQSKKASPVFDICVDCAYEDKMSPKERNSLASQIRWCYANNKKAQYPVTVHVTNLGGDTLQRLEKVNGFDQWSKRNFITTTEELQDVYQHHPTDDVGDSSQPDDKGQEPSKKKKKTLVYLTADSETVLETLQDDHVYVIGGIVDRNRWKHVTLERANQLGMATAKLPFATCGVSMAATNVLTCNHVFDILIQYKEHGHDWQKTILNVLPPRKEAK